MPIGATRHSAKNAVLSGFILGVLLLHVGVLLAARQVPQDSPNRPAIDVPTFSRDVAPVIFARCTGCHRPNGSAPFSLLTYTEVRARARQIAGVVKNRIMPPWKPEPGSGEFLDSRRLNDREVELIGRWVDQGAPEGDAADLPPRPHWTDGWQLGEPDLIVTMPEPYTLPAGGPDVFRNFVMPVASTTRRYIRAWEFRPGNTSVVHHAVMGFDVTRAARRLDDLEPGPGYSGLVPFSVRDPEGYFLGWTPGQRQPQTAVDRSAWTLDAGSDLVVTMHLRPSGRQETVQAQLGLYFSPAPPAERPVMLRLGRQSLDIPAGDSQYTITDSYTLPVDVLVQSVYPHAHNLATRMKGLATLPDGTKRSLIYIKEWDFDWQDVYRYTTPISLPAGSTLQMEYVYDNSTENPRNPHRPPERVRYGPSSSDEMGDLWVQVVPRDPADWERLTTGFGRKLLPETLAGLEMMLTGDPDNVGLHNQAALMYEETGDLVRAAHHLAESLRIDPRSPAAHSNLGASLLKSGKTEEARAQLLEALRLDPDHAGAHYNLGTLLERSGKLQEAESHFRETIRIDPDHYAARANLGIVLQLQGRVKEAVGQYREALRINPAYAEAYQLLGLAFKSEGRTEEAIEQYRQAIRAKPDWEVPLIDLAWILATAPDETARRPAEAVSLAERAVGMSNPRSASALDALAAALAAQGEFEQALVVAEAALASASAGTNSSRLAEEIRERIALYRQHKPYRAPR